MVPREQRGRLTRLLYKTGIKPSVARRNSLFRSGKLLFSADFEMAWAFQYSRSLHGQAVEKGLQERENIPRLLSLFEKFAIPVTWATVGHLFLERCERTGGTAHAGLPRPGFLGNEKWLFAKGDWYQHDPGTDFNRDPAWYAPDLIDLVLNSPLPHEIACHSFSHVDFTYKNCPPELAEAEVEICQRLAAKKGILLKSMVFPAGTAGNFEVLARRGFIAYRRQMKCNIDLPVIDRHGLVAIPSSWGLDKSPYGWPAAAYLKMAQAYLAKAVKSKMVCHFWFHPSMDAWYMSQVLPGILAMAASHRDRGDLEIVTMRTLAEKVLQDDPFPN